MNIAVISISHYGVIPQHNLHTWQIYVLTYSRHLAWHEGPLLLINALCEQSRHSQNALCGRRHVHSVFSSHGDISLVRVPRKAFHMGGNHHSDATGEIPWFGRDGVEVKFPLNLDYISISARAKHFTGKLRWGSINTCWYAENYRVSSLSKEPHIKPTHLIVNQRLLFFTLHQLASLLFCPTPQNMNGKLRTRGSACHGGIHVN